MKKLLYTICIGSALLLTSLSSCEKLTDVNVDPNNASSTHPQALLTNVEWNAFNTWRGTSPLYTLKMILQTDGENANQIYNWQRGNFDQYSHLRNVTKMMEEAAAIEEPTYTALGKFFRAYYFYNLTLTFGDIPYSEALQGESKGLYQPKYDEQKAVFVGILAELAEADVLLQENQDRIAGDIIYGGNTENWRKLINAFRLKVLLTLSHKTSDSELNIAQQFAQIVANGTLLTSDADDGQLLYLDQQDNRYPEFNSSGYGSGMYMDSTFIRRLQDHQDPRLFAIASQTRLGREAGAALDDFSSYEGGDPIVPYALVNDKAIAGRLSKVHDRYTMDPTCEPMVLLGYAEQQFILAEAIVRGWITGDVVATYNTGVRAAFNFYAKYAKNMGQYFTADRADAYLQLPIVNLATVTTNNERIERIMMQKYLRSFHQGGYSAYFDHLRTDYPLLRKAPNVRTAYRWMYPQKEYNQNTSQVQVAIQRQFSGNDAIQQQTWWTK
ncbi:SusD/RagB family nutrient-binding outer membrane lipoprotein [Sphingobacterium sp. lm-10]|uniref:SusD/RagB family nutrient-binding outer membrane lipoprotein n=1 Tax=Sphingobacterium sp. lm-10 TaxID=2944904 RepID=UPI002020D965|nr:SusD/RagB family nutrient-binding outer membrane lipoprotein [Sphingobacterium sp. lm-10]MCL7987024.1 SusD/RagB family nutrient-binding outer membrane lipoprotein [Sphingobacterium sp. lm-10]